MTSNITREEADRLTREFARVAGVSLSEAVVIAMREALERRRSLESPRETAARLRERHGVLLPRPAREPLPREAYDTPWENP